MHSATQITKQINRWHLVKLDQRVIDEPTDDPMDDIVRIVMVRAGTGIRSNRFRNSREFHTTNRELLKIADRLRPHPRYPISKC